MQPSPNAAHHLRAIAVAAEVDPRTIRQVIGGEPPRAIARERMDRALTAADVRYLVSPDDLRRVPATDQDVPLRQHGSHAVAHWGEHLPSQRAGLHVRNLDPVRRAADMPRDGSTPKWGAMRRSEPRKSLGMDASTTLRSNASRPRAAESAPNRSEMTSLSATARAAGSSWSTPP